jgi:predicted CDP-diglyceride synthetase/phosphatidate cytidylyltransferase
MNNSNIRRLDMLQIKLYFFFKYFKNLEMLFLLMVNKLNKSTDQFHALQQSNQIRKHNVLISSYCMTHVVNRFKEN